MFLHSILFYEALILTHEYFIHHRSTALELLQRPARRRRVVWRLRRAVDVSALPQDGR